MTVNSINKSKIEAFRSAWTRIAPDDSFGDMFLADFQKASQVLLDSHLDIDELERQLKSKKADWSIANRATTELLQRVVSGVRSKPGYGHDSALYESLGYTRKSQRKSGLTRKGLARTASANVA